MQESYVNLLKEGGGGFAQAQDKALTYCEALTEGQVTLREPVYQKSTLSVTRTHQTSNSLPTEYAQTQHLLLRESEKNNSCFTCWLSCHCFVF